MYNVCMYIDVDKLRNKLVNNEINLIFNFKNIIIL